jgi:ABC-type oligopeptide transport system substrate-binding subunit
MRTKGYASGRHLLLSAPTFGNMRRRILSLLLLIASALVLLQACGPKPQYKTREGKKKLKHYNSIQYEQPQP